MASTRNIAASLQWVLPQLFYQPVTIAGDDPALTAANLIKQTILGAPFVWPWNRQEVSLQLVAGQQDAILASATLGNIERGTLDDLQDTPTSIKEIELKTSLSKESRPQRPASFAIHLDDGAGNLTIRTNTLPDAAYLLTLQAQRRPIPITSMASTWAPIPDELAYLYDWGMLAMLAMLTKDARTGAFRQTFVGHLLGCQYGLTDMQRDLFLGNWLQIDTAPLRAQSRAQQGIQGRTQ